MALELCEAVTLKAFDWSESSRTVVFFSREFGKLPLADKGGHRIKTKKGRLLPFARLKLSFYQSERSPRGYVNDCELVEYFSFEKDGTLGRLAYGSAACELLYLLLPEEQPQTQLYQYFVSFLAFLDKVDKHGLPSIFITFFLRLLSQLGYHPSMSYCTGCGRDWERPDPGDETPILFSSERGGYVCRACQQVGEQYIALPPSAFELLVRLQTASLEEAARVELRFQQASYLLDALTKFLSHQAEIRTDLKSLEFLDKLKKSHLLIEKGGHEYDQDGQS